LVEFRQLEDLLQMLINPRKTKFAIHLGKMKSAGDKLAQFDTPDRFERLEFELDQRAGWDHLERIENFGESTRVSGNHAGPSATVNAVVFVQGRDGHRRDPFA